jgi:hypothetical protein
LALTFREILAFFVEFERALEAEAPTGVFSACPRDEIALLKAFEAYFQGPMRLLEIDSYDGLEPPTGQNDSSEVAGPALRKDELASLILIFFENGFPKKADILINSGLLDSGAPIFNKCYRRFLAMKEAFHAILRLEFARRNDPYPDAADSVTILKTLEKLIYLPFAIIDFDNPEYDDDIKVENAAQLLAILILYPIEQINADRAQFLEEFDGGDANFENPEIIVTRSYEFAAKHRVPQRYVDMLFRWKLFPSIYSQYRQLKRGY